MLAQLTASSAVPGALNAAHLLVLMPKGKTLPTGLPQRCLLAKVIKRRGMKADELASSPVRANTLQCSCCKDTLSSVE
jgi:hypothetical protein